MILIDSLKSHLVTRVEFLKINPDRVQVYVEKGSILWQGKGLSHRQHYTAVIELDEWPDIDSNLVLVPILEWYQANQDPVLSPDESLIRFDTYQLSDKTTTVIFEIKLKESIIVKSTETGYVVNTCERACNE